MAKNQKPKPASQRSDARKHHGGNSTRTQFVRFGDGSTYPTKPWKIDCGGYMGTSTIKQPFDAKQAELNRLAGFC